MKGPFVVEVEIEGVRSFHGPFDGGVSAMQFVNEHYSRFRTLVHRLNEPTKIDRSVHPDQTTINDHLSQTHDHVG